VIAAASNLIKLHSDGIFASIADRMKRIGRMLSIAVFAAAMAIAQGSEGQTQGQPKPTPRDPTQSPASRRPPQTVTRQIYPIEQVQSGELRFISQCGFCHGRDAAGGETGPDLTRSKLVTEDNRGDLIRPLVRNGRPEKGMPAFNLSDTDLAAIVAFIHDQKTKAEALGGGRRSVEAADLATGDASKGRRYFNGAGGCSACHSAKGNLAGIASRYQGLALLQRMLYPSGRPAPALPKVTVSLPSGQTFTAPLASEDEFSIVVIDASGARQKYNKNSLKFRIENPISAHFDQLAKYTDADMHDVYAYLVTLR
jgi:cytochrome c oxidase cbb3-type subunit 3